MATNKKSKYWLVIQAPTATSGTETEPSGGSAIQLNLDPDIYNAAVQALVDVTPTAPTSGAILPLSIKHAAKSTAATILKCVAITGTVNAPTATRTLHLICQTAAKSSAITSIAATPVTVALGFGNSKTNWQIVSAS